MRQVVTTRNGGVEVLEVQNAPDPKPGPGEVVIDVCAAGRVIGDEIRERIEHSIHITECCCVSEENETDCDILHGGNAQHSDIATPDERLINCHQKTYEKDDLSNLNGNEHDV